MREENETVAEFEEGADPNERAVFAMAHLFRWVLDGSGLEEGANTTANSNRWPGENTVAAKFIALTLVVRPDLLREQVLRKLGSEAGCGYTRLCRYAKKAEADFGYIFPKRGRATRPKLVLVDDLYAKNEFRAR